MENEERVEKVGTCRFCHQQRYVEHVDESMSQEEVDEIASIECDCEEAMRARELSNSVRAVEESIRRNASLVKEVREGVCGLLKPVALGYIQNVTVKVDDLTTLKISIKKGRLTCVKTVKEDTIIDEMGGH